MSSLDSRCFYRGALMLSSRRLGQSGPITAINNIKHRTVEVYFKSWLVNVLLGHKVTSALTKPFPHHTICMTDNELIQWQLGSFCGWDSSLLSLFWKPWKPAWFQVSGVSAARTQSTGERQSAWWQQWAANFSGCRLCCHVRRQTYQTRTRAHNCRHPLLVHVRSRVREGAGICAGQWLPLPVGHWQLKSCFGNTWLRQKKKQE